MEQKYFKHITNGTEKNSLSFELHDVDLSIVNSLRRIILSEIPNVAFLFKQQDHLVDSDIIFHKNDSALHNEIMAQRLSMLPLCFSENEIDGWNLGKIDDYTFVIDVKNTSQNMMEITTEHFTIFDKDRNEMPSTFTKRIFPPNDITKDYIILTKLPFVTEQGNTTPSFKVEAKAQKGISKDCTAFCPVSKCTFFNTIDDDKVEAKKKELTKDKSPQEAKQIISDFMSLDYERCFKTNKYDEPNAFTMSITSECALSAKYIFAKACEILIETMKLVADEFKSQTSKMIEMQPLNDTPNFYLIIIKGHTHTLGNVVQSLLMNMYVREKQEVDYIGYSVPHPLENTVIFKIKFTNDVDIIEAKKFMSVAILEMVEIVQDIYMEWKKN